MSRRVLGSLLVFCTLALSAAAQKKVLISTDLATGLQGGWRGGWSDPDDGWAVAMAWRDRAAFDVRGIAVTFGNNNVEPEMIVAGRLLALLGRTDVPLKQGAAVKLTDPWTKKHKTGLSDFNVVMDARALTTLLQQTKIPMTFMTFSLTKSALLPRARIEALKTIGTPLAGFFYGGSHPWVLQFESIFGEAGFHPWDQNVVHYAAQPSAGEKEKERFVEANFAIFK